MITNQSDANLRNIDYSFKSSLIPTLLRVRKLQQAFSKAFLFVVTVFLTLSDLSPTTTYGQNGFSCPDPDRCTSKDLEVVDAFISGVDECLTCTPGTTITGTLNFSIINKTGSVRTSFALFGTISGTTNPAPGPLAVCGGPIAANSTTTIATRQISFVCGTEVRLTNVFLAWTDASDNATRTCPAILADACASIAPKCGTDDEIIIRTPLSVAISNTQNPCVGQSNGSITATASGGEAPYTYTLLQGSTVIASNSNGVFNNLPAGTYTVRVEDANDCVVTSSQVTLTAIVIAAPTTTDITICAPGQVTLTATGCANGTLLFYANATGGSPLGSPTVNVTANTTYYVSCKVGDCESPRAAIDITIASIPAPNTEDVTICAPGNVTLTATGCAGTLVFYANATGGNPLPSATVNVTATTTYYVACKVGNCEGPRAPIKVTITSIPAPNISDITICGPGQVTLTATGCTGTLLFYANASGGDPLPSATVNVTATTTYYVSCKVGNCESPRSPIKVTIVPITPPTTTDITICGPGQVTLTATGCTGTLLFYANASGGDPLPSATVNVTATTTYYVSCKVGNCESGRVPIKVTIIPITPPVVTCPVTYCGPTKVKLTASGCYGGTLLWYKENGDFVGEGSPEVQVNETTNFYVICKKGDCKSEKVIVKIIIIIVEKPVVTCPVTYCGPAYVTLKASGCYGGILYWYKEDGTPVGTGSPSVQVNTTTKFYVVCKKGNCVSDKVWVTIYIIKVEKPVVTCPVTYCGPAYVTLKASGCYGGILYWYKEDGTPVGTGSPSVQVNTTTKFYVVCKKGNCVSDKVWVTIYIIKVEKPVVTCPVTYCGPAYVTLKASGCYGGILYWYKADGTPVGTGSPTIQVTTTTNFYVVCKKGDCISEKVWFKIMIIAKPICTLKAPYTLPTCGSAGNKLCVATATPGVIYQWFVTGTGWTITSGQGTPCITYTAGATGTAGTFTLKVTKYGCSNTCTVTIKCRTPYACTPGFWKNNTTYWNETKDGVSLCIANAKPAPYNGNATTGSLFRETFGLTSAQMQAAGLNPNLTLLQALQSGGGGCFKLLRHATAALLNSCGLTSYAYTTVQVLTMTHDAIITKACEPTASKFATANEAGTCPLKGDGNQGRPIVKSENSDENITVSVSPNPYQSFVRFVIKSPVSGEANLDVFNVLGQRLHNVYKGHIDAGRSQVVDFNVPPAIRTNLIYRLNVAGRFVTGRVIKQ